MVILNLTIEERNKYKDILKNYNLIKATIRGIDLEIEYLKNNNELSLDREKLLIRNKKEYEKIIDRIDNKLKTLSYKEKKLIELRYLNFEKLTWDKIADILNFSEGYCRNKLQNKCLIKVFKL